MVTQKLTNTHAVLALVCLTVCCTRRRYFMDAAQQIGRPPLRCIVIGASNTSVEAAHELGMKCVVLSGTQPVYNFTSADLVVRDLSQLSFLNLKKLFAIEGLVEPRSSAEGSSERPNSDSLNDYSLFGGDDSYGNEEEDYMGGLDDDPAFNSSRPVGGLMGSGGGF